MPSYYNLFPSQSYHYTYSLRCDICQGQHFYPSPKLFHELEKGQRQETDSFRLLWFSCKYRWKAFFNNWSEMQQNILIFSFFCSTAAMCGLKKQRQQFMTSALHCTASVENVKICQMCKNCRLRKICKICQMAGKRRWTKTLEFENKEENVPAAVRSC